MWLQLQVSQFDVEIVSLAPPTPHFTGTRKDSHSPRLRSPIVADVDEDFHVQIVTCGSNCRSVNSMFEIASLAPPTPHFTGTGKILTAPLTAPDSSRC